jgi:hypothetical protein
MLPLCLILSYAPIIFDTPYVYFFYLWSFVSNILSFMLILESGRHIGDGIYNDLLYSFTFREASYEQKEEATKMHGKISGYLITWVCQRNVMTSLESFIPCKKLCLKTIS